jgi:Domain of unknown function (DUF1707)
VRLTDADREELFSRLSEHAARDHVDSAEHERRIELIAEARTWDQATAAFDDLPAVVTGGEREPRPAPWFGGHADSDAPGPGWKPTAERFRDPRTRRVMRVWEDPAGRRHYVPDEPM